MVLLKTIENTLWNTYYQSNLLIRGPKTTKLWLDPHIEPDLSLIYLLKGNPGDLGDKLKDLPVSIYTGTLVPHACYYLIPHLIVDQDKYLTSRVSILKAFIALGHYPPADLCLEIPAPRVTPEEARMMACSLIQYRIELIDEKIKKLIDTGA